MEAALNRINAKITEAPTTLHDVGAVNVLERVLVYGDLKDIELAGASLEPLGRSSIVAQRLAKVAWLCTRISTFEKVKKPLSMVELPHLNSLHDFISASGPPNPYHTHGELAGKTVEFVILWRCRLLAAAQNIVSCGDGHDRKLGERIIACMSGEPATKRARIVLSQSASATR